MATKKPKVQTEYGDDAIDVLLGLEPVRKRPGMYVGDIREVSYKAFQEILDNSTDEAQAGHCGTIDVYFTDKMTRCTIRDDGRGIPLGENKKARNGDGSQMSTIKAIFTILHAGGKFGGENSGYKVSGGLHGVGSSVVTALSSEFYAVTRREGKMRTYWALNGHTVDASGELNEDYDAPVMKGDGGKDGMEVTFQMNHELKSLEGNGKTFDWDLCRNYMQTKAFLIPGLTLNLYKEDQLKETFYYEDSSEHFKQFISEAGFELIHSAPVHLREDNEKTGTFLDMTIGFTDSAYKDAVKAWTNTVPQPNGGTHVDGMLAGIFDGFQAAGLYDEANEEVIFKNFEQQDITRGTFALLHIGIEEASYNAQDKKKLVTEAAYKLCYDFAKKLVAQFVEDDWAGAVAVAQAAQIRCENRKRSSKLRELNSQLNLGKKGAATLIVQDGYTECLSNKPAERELFIVEGDSASGNMKRARNKATQAIQQLRGKITNAARASADKVLAHKELSSVINAMACGISEVCDPSKSRFSKIIIATDADSDGSHIRAMLIAFFNSYMRPVVESGMLYVVSPPLFGATNRSKWPGYTAYGQDGYDLMHQIEEGKRSLDQLRKAYPEEEALLAELSKQGWNITRYKGLGEMNEAQTTYTLCDPETRILRRITASDSIEQDMAEIDGIMGEDVTLRKAIIGGVPERFGNYEG